MISKGMKAAAKWLNKTAKSEKTRRVDGTIKKLKNDASEAGAKVGGMAKEGLKKAQEKISEASGGAVDNVVSAVKANPKKAAAGGALATAGVAAALSGDDDKKKKKKRPYMD